MKIEWASNFAPDGSRRNPPPSTIHGWLAKWRGTLSGNEHLRSRGMTEMRKAASYRKARKKYEQKKAEKQGRSGGGLLSLFRRNRTSTARQPTRLTPRPRVRSARPPRSRDKNSRGSGRRLATSRKPESNTSRRKRPPTHSRLQPKPHQHNSSRRTNGRH